MADLEHLLDGVVKDEEAEGELAAEHKVVVVVDVPDQPHRPAEVKHAQHRIASTISTPCHAACAGGGWWVVGGVGGGRHGIRRVQGGLEAH